MGIGGCFVLVALWGCFFQITLPLGAESQTMNFWSYLRKHATHLLGAFQDLFCAANFEEFPISGHAPTPHTYVTSVIAHKSLESSNTLCPIQAVSVTRQSTV